MSSEPKPSGTKGQSKSVLSQREISALVVMYTSSDGPGYVAQCTIEQLVNDASIKLGRTVTSHNVMGILESLDMCPKGFNERKKQSLSKHEQIADRFRRHDSRLRAVEAWIKDMDPKFAAGVAADDS